MPAINNKTIGDTTPKYITNTTENADFTSTAYILTG